MKTATAIESLRTVAGLAGAPATIAVIEAIVIGPIIRIMHLGGAWG